MKIYIIIKIALVNIHSLEKDLELISTLRALSFKPISLSTNPHILKHSLYHSFSIRCWA
jgi:hypothetical protein